jgi:glycerophosphoryl diester phosphodiesterase
MRSLKLISILFFLSLYGCKKDAPAFLVHNLNHDQIILLGHAGMGEAFKYPGNSYESIDPCLKTGADGSEMDIQLTKDSVLVVFHNENLNEFSSCEGLINEHNWKDIDGCLFSSPISSQIYIMSATNLFNRIDHPAQFYFTLDCKFHPSGIDYYEYKRQFARAIHRLTNEFDLDTNVTIESGDAEFLRYLKELNPRFKTFILASNLHKALIAGSDAVSYGVTLRNDSVTADDISKLHEKGYRVALWGLQTDDDNVNAVQKSPDYLQSDKIIPLVKMFGKYKK